MHRRYIVDSDMRIMRAPCSGYFHLCLTFFPRSYRAFFVVEVAHMSSPFLLEFMSNYTYACHVPFECVWEWIFGHISDVRPREICQRDQQ